MFPYGFFQTLQFYLSFPLLVEVPPVFFHFPFYSTCFLLLYSLQLSPLWSLFDFLVSSVTPGYILKSKYSEIRPTNEKKNSAFVSLGLGYLTQYSLVLFIQLQISFFLQLNRIPNGLKTSIRNLKLLKENISCRILQDKDVRKGLLNRIPIVANDCK